MNIKKNKFDRRRFLELLAASGIVVYLPACSDSDEQNIPPPNGKKALVLGAGLAGLSAAYELSKQGWEVSVLEAQARVGGRVHTHREGFEEAQYAELGAVRIPDVHEHTLGYVQELGLTLEEFKDGAPLYFVQGKRFVHMDGDPWSLNGLSAQEVSQGLDMWSTYIAGHFAEFGSPRDGTFPLSGIVEKYDGMTWSEYLSSVGATSAWVDLYTADNGTEISKIGCLAWMAAEVADQDWDKTYCVKGGNDLIAQALAEKLKGKILLERAVTKIEQTEAGVRVTATFNGAGEAHEADHLVCAIPFSTLRDVEISPALPADKQQVIDELFMMPVSRGYFQTKSRFWQTDMAGAVGGLKIAKTDTGAERLWDLSNIQPGTSGLVMSYMQHNNATTYAAVVDGGREAYLQGEIEKFFPAIATEKTQFIEKIWQNDPWVKGAWTDLLPGQWAWAAIIGRAEGRIHFAGEHTSIWAGWMQGAIESGKRAAAEIASGA